MQPFNKAVSTLALAVLLTAVGGCSEYLDRRDPIVASGGNAVATDIVTQMVDPWPPASANRNIAFNGAKMQTAVERYRTNRVVPPRGVGTSSTYAEPSPGGAATPVGQNNSGPVGPGITQAPVK
ncbi:MAG TPA: hypothetical protein VKG24_16285 [Pseudolabrys sp.]|jgi:hypothetical protein|nr:hypothetical protein [Pseudolabrys sp.]